MSSSVVSPKSTSSSGTYTDKEKANEFDLFDDRPLISVLLKEHESAIDAIKNILKSNSLYQENITLYDDIWILRFVLSHKKKVSAAAKAALETIRFRAEKKLNELGDIRHRVPTQDPSQTDNMFPASKRMNEHVSEGGSYHVLPDAQRGVITYIRVDKVDMKALNSELSDSDILDSIIYLNETIYQILDHMTRKTGRLTKLLKVVDLQGVGLKNFNLTFIKKDAANTKKMEDFYPQMLGMLVVANASSWFSKLWKVVRKFFPARFVEKVDILPSVDKVKEKDLKLVFKYISYENLPVQYGGLNTTWPPQEVGHFFKK